MAAKNLTIFGELYLNSIKIYDIDNFSNQIAYVMQDDILLATFTPYEAFVFTANMRLKSLTLEERIERVK